MSEIRENIGVDCWRNVPTECNPADIATRRNQKVKFNEVLWFKGAPFLRQDEKGWPMCETIGDISENVDEKEVIVATNLTQGVCHFINIERFSTLGKLVRVTSWVKRFIRNLQARVGLCEVIDGDLLVEEMEEATLAWCKYEQSVMVNEKHFEKQKLNLNLFYDDKRLYRSSPRINTKNIQFLQKQPILVRSDSYFTKLLIWKCHEDVHHCGVESALNKLRQTYWIIKGRQTVKKVLSKCIICKIVQGKTSLAPSTAKLLEYRLYFEYPFENVGLDYAGPLFTRYISERVEKHSNLIYSYLHVLLHGILI